MGEKPAFEKKNAFSLPTLSLGFCLFLVLSAGFLVYSNTFNSAFQFDDALSITGNLSIRHLDAGRIWHFWPTRFLTYLSFALNYQLGGTQVFGYHLFNILVHSANALLVFVLAKLLSRTAPLKSRGIGPLVSYWALFAGLLFAVHPVQTQAVTYVAQRAALLSALGCLAASVLYLMARLKESKGQRFGYWYLCALLTAFLTMFTKENAVILPVLIGLLEGIFFKPNVKRILPFVGAALVVPVTMLLTGSVDFMGMRRIGEPSGHIPVYFYALTQLRVIVTYIRLAVFPVNQTLDYDYPVYSSWNFGSLAGLALIAFLAVLAWKQRRQRPLFSFGMAWFLLALLPESGFVPIRDVIFEHRMYLPMAGFCWLLPSRIWEIFRKNSRRAVIGLCVVAVLFSIRAYNRNQVWKDPLTLWNDVLTKAPHKARAFKARGFEYEKQGKMNQALQDYQKAIALNPSYDQAYFNRAHILIALHRYDLAMEDLDKAISLNPEYAQSYHNRAILFAMKKDYAKALVDLNSAIGLDGEYAEAFRNRALVYLSTGQKQRAEEDFRQAVRLDPQDAAGFYGLAMVLADQGEWKPSLVYLRKAMTLGYRPDPKIVRQISSSAAATGL